MAANWQQRLEQVQQIEITDDLVEEVYEYVNQDAPDPRDFHATYRVLFRGSEKKYEVEMYWWESGISWLEYPDDYLLDVGFDSFNPDHSRNFVREHLKQMVSSRIQEIESHISAPY